MIKIVVDTNIVFSALLSSSGDFAKIILEENSFFQFYSCDFLKLELAEQRPKILKYTKLTNEELRDLELTIVSKINFIDKIFIQKKYLKNAEELLKDIDDVLFVALTNHLKAKLWTGDKELINGLRKKKFKNIITTTELLKLLSKLKGNKD